jgi:hypothetical protein
MVVWVSGSAEIPGSERIIGRTHATLIHKDRRQSLASWSAKEVIAFAAVSLIIDKYERCGGAALVEVCWGNPNFRLARARE